MTRAALCGHVCALLLAACAAGRGPKAPPAGGGSGSDASTKPPESDASLDDEDGGTMVKPAPVSPFFECEHVDPLGFQNDDLHITSRPSGVSLPADFTVTRAATRWSESCDAPEVVIELSEGGCPNGSGQRLTFYLSAAGIADGRVRTHQNVLGSDDQDTGIRVRYERPFTVAPSGVWGTCEGASGTVNFVTAPTTQPNEKMVARFQLELTDCQNGKRAAQTLQGSFNVALKRALGEVCASP